MNAPIYQQIYRYLLSRIHSGELQPGDKLPSERQLAVDFKSSNTSVRKALDILTQEGFITKQHGSGNYVNGKVAVANAKGGADIVLVIPRQRGIDVGLPMLKSQFESALADINVKIISLDAVVLKADQARDLVARHGKPMLVLNSRNQTAEMAAQGLLLPMEDIPGMAERLDRIPEHLKWRFVGENGELRSFGCPYLYITNGLALNIDLAEKAGLDVSNPPMVWSELLAWGHSFEKWRLSTKHHDLHPFFCYHRHFYQNSGAFYIMASNGNPWCLDGRELKRCLEEYFSFVEGLLTDGMTESCPIQSPDSFVSGKYLFHLQGGSWLPRDIEKFCPDMRWRLLPFPLPNHNRPRFSNNGTQLLSLLPSEKKVDESLFSKVLDVLYDFPLYSNLAWRFGALPSDFAAARLFVKAHPSMEKYMDLLFFSFEPHYPLDESIAANINELVRHRLENTTMRLDEEAINTHMDFVNNLVASIV